MDYKRKGQNVGFRDKKDNKLVLSYIELSVSRKLFNFAVFYKNQRRAGRYFMKSNLLRKRGTAALAAGVLAVTSIVGCGEKTSNIDTNTTEATIGTTGETVGKEESNTVSYPMAGVTLTYGMTTAGAWKDRYNSFAELPLGQELQKQTGVTLDMVQVENNSAMNLLIASGELPDIIGFNWQGNYTGGEEKAIEDGVIYGMSEEFVKENAPDYWKVLSENPELLKQVKTPSGDIFGFAFILGDEILKTGFGLIVRDDWCEELGLEVPETADEYYEMLKAFKEKKGVEIPLCVTMGNLGSMLDSGIITSPFHLVTRDFYVNEGEVNLGFYQEEYKDVLAWLNKIYTEGLLDPNFATIDQATVTSNMLTGKSGASAGACGSVLGTWLNTNKDIAEFSLAGAKNLVAKRGDTALYGHYNTDIVGSTAVITDSCKDKEAAANYLNYGYTEEGHMLYNFGIEGVSYEMVDGKPVYTDLIMNNPDGLTIQKALSEYQLAYGNGPFVQDKDYLMQYYSTDEQKEALDAWTDNTAKNYKLPRISINSDDIGEYSSLISDIETYRDEMAIKFIRGTESLENYDKYLNTLKTMGADRLIEIVQNAVYEYNSR